MRNLLFMAGLAALGGCAAPINEIGRPPIMSPVGSGLDTTKTAASVYQYPEAPASPPKRFSLWNDRQSRLFTDPRALLPGDLLTVRININDRAHFKNDSDRSRVALRTLGLGGDAEWDDFSTGGSAKGNIGSTTTTKGSGETERSEDLELRVAAVVTDVFPNGNMMIRGSQEVRVNAELRILTIAGIVRPQDIGAENTIAYDRIAEARISYGGRGRLTEVQQPPYGQQILDNVLPF
jgi:flagellar L-ring protein precursor FlgH